jgi:hypothetical protein
MIGDRMRDVIFAPLPGLDLRREYGHHQSRVMLRRVLVLVRFAMDSPLEEEGFELLVPPSKGQP